MANKTANTITVRATAPVVDIIERIIRSNDKPRAEVLIDVQILEVNRARAKQFGLNLNAYALGFTFSPEVAPPNTSSPPTGPPNSPPPFNVNTISQGVSTADFYMSVPTAVVRFLESDSHTKTIAKPQLRGAEGQKLTLNLGDDIPVLSTVFGQAAAGGFASIPQSSFNYRSVGVILARDLRRRNHPRAARRE
jgi:type II secretory pathway component GspD/PulD (secretin)